MAKDKKYFNFGMSLAGSYFCAWDTKKLWFADDTSQAITKENAYRLALVDLDNDGNDDVVINGTKTVNGKSEAHPQVFLGDGAGRAETDDARDVDRP